MHCLSTALRYIWDVLQRYCNFLIFVLMVVFDEILSELLMQNSCVVIPSLGGFVANTVSATVDVRKGSIVPPQKALSFNRNLSNNDGLFVSKLAQKTSTTYNEADRSVANEVTQIKAKLNAGERVHFQNVGFIYLNEAGKIAFEQDRFFNLLLASYGMGSLQFVPAEEQKQVEPIINAAPNPTIQETAQHVAEEKPEEKIIPIGGVNGTEKQPTNEEVEPASKKSPILRKLVKYAAVAALIPVAFYSFWIPMKTDVLQSGVVFAEDFNPFVNKEEAKYVSGLENNTIEVDEVEEVNSFESMAVQLSESDVAAFSFPLFDDKFFTISKPGLKEAVVKKEAVSSGNYHLIVGCFAEKKNALKMLSEMEKLEVNAFILDKKNGLHRVAAFSNTDKEALDQKRSLLLNKGFNSWVLKK
jgi:hypothetical protein